MELEQARLALLQSELSALQGTIRGLDSILFQIKGWTVTAALAIAGITVTSGQRALLLVGGAAVLGFWLVECQFKTVQRIYILRNRQMTKTLAAIGVIELLRDESHHTIGPAAGPSPHDIEDRRTRYVNYARSLWHEAASPATFSLYLFIVVCLGIEGILI